MASANGAPRIDRDDGGKREETGMRQRTLRCVAAAAVAMAAAMPAQAAELVIGVGDWPSARATAHLVKAIVETRLGVTAELKPGTTHDLFVATDAGDIDILPEVWLPNDRGDVKIYVDKTHTITLLPRGVPARQGLCTTKETAE